MEMPNNTQDNATKLLQTSSTYIKLSLPAVPRVSTNTRTPCADMFEPYPNPSTRTRRSPRVALQQTQPGFS